VVDVVPAGSAGAIDEGPVDAPLNGNPVSWWHVHIDNGDNGWIDQGVPPDISDDQRLQPICRGAVAVEAETRIDWPPATEAATRASRPVKCGS
jgi:hypothetical protein